MQTRLLAFLILTLALMARSVAWGADIRRPIDTLRPMWLVHVTSMDQEDVAETVDGLPDDLKPYIVLNLAMNHRADPALLDRYMGNARQNIRLNSFTTLTPKLLEFSL